MKIKCFYYPLKTRNQKGYILFPLLLITALSLIAVSHSISVYQNAVQISKYHEESLIRDSLYQMAGAQVKEDLPTIQWNLTPVQREYLFPTGKVTVLINQKGERLVECHFQINPAQGKTTTKYKVLTIP